MQRATVSSPVMIPQMNHKSLPGTPVDDLLMQEMMQLTRDLTPPAVEWKRGQPMASKMTRMHSPSVRPHSLDVAPLRHI
ncbi:hypothetical protein PROFUN_06580 [Planoprotostelium fungivorum]|uniref:Uncharacterized protein n=1 Tax=Planoprotostelium fungivorum TaxID=1890364 RepID=A0A2P6MRX0_9EUKA|nr:hypothetical protein PROFUN_06580 [Planoprotostelium fungivorum]